MEDMIHMNEDEIYFARITYDAAKDYFNSSKANLIMRQAFNNWGWDIFEDSNNYKLDPDTDDVIVCINWTLNVDIDGEDLDTDLMLEELSVEELEPYTREGTDEDIKKYFTEYELKDSLDIEGVVYDLLGDGYRLSVILDDLKDTSLPITEDL